MPTPRKRISNFQAVALISLSVVFDLLSLIPIVDWIVLILYWIIFPIWFKLLGISLLQARKMGSLMVTSVIEAIPFVSMLPGFTVSTILIIKNVRKEDKRYNAAQAADIFQAQSQRQAQEQAALEYERYMEQNMVESE